MPAHVHPARPMAASGDAAVVLALGMAGGRRPEPGPGRVRAGEDRSEQDEKTSQLDRRSQRTTSRAVLNYARDNRSLTIRNSALEESAANMSILSPPGRRPRRFCRESAAGQRHHYPFGIKIFYAERRVVLLIPAESRRAGSDPRS